jgi:hypothetical protein
MTRHRARAFGAIPLIVTLSVGVWGCSSAGASTTPSQASASAGASTSASASGSTPASESPSSEPSHEGPATVSFVTPVPKSTWGASFTVEAEATDGSAITYSAEGDCSVNETSGKVKAESVGTCKITAAAVDADPPISATQNFNIAKAKPVIHFDDASTRFARPFKYQLKVSVTPDIPLKMVVDLDAAGGNNDEFCTIKNGALVFNKTPTADDFPQIPAVCVVKVSGSGAKNYEAPKAVSRKITIDLAAFDVDAREAFNVDYSDDGGVLTFTVRENSGDAFGLNVESDDFHCVVASTTPEKSPAGNTRYKVTVELQDPDGDPPDEVPYKCPMTASAQPPDYQGGKPADKFVINVVP